MAEYFTEEVAEIKKLQDELNKLDEDKDAKTAKIKQLKNDLSSIDTRRVELEKTLNEASAMLMDGRLSDEDFVTLKRELAAIYQSNDETDSLLGAHERGLNSDYPKKHAEIQSMIQRKKAALLAKYAQQIAFEIVDRSELQLKQLLAIIPGNVMRVEQLRGLDLGDCLLFALNHEKNGNKKRIDPDENKKLYQNVLQEFGV